MHQSLPEWILSCLICSDRYETKLVLSQLVVCGSKHQYTNTYFCFLFLSKPRTFFVFTPCTINWDRKSFVLCLSKHIRQHIIHSGSDWCIYRREIEKTRAAFCRWGLKCDRIVTKVKLHTTVLRLSRLYSYELDIYR